MSVEVALLSIAIFINDITMLEYRSEMTSLYSRHTPVELVECTIFEGVSASLSLDPEDDLNLLEDGEEVYVSPTMRIHGVRLYEELMEVQDSLFGYNDRHDNDRQDIFSSLVLGRTKLGHIFESKGLKGMGVYVDLENLSGARSVFSAAALEACEVLRGEINSYNGLLSFYEQYVVPKTPVDETAIIAVAAIAGFRLSELERKFKFNSVDPSIVLLNN